MKLSAQKFNSEKGVIGYDPQITAIFYWNR